MLWSAVMPADIFSNAVSRRIWEIKYRYCRPDGTCEDTIHDSWRRVAAALAAAEEDSAFWQDRFYSILDDFRFLPAGRILAGCGTGRHVTLFNCFVMGTIEDSMDGIFTALKEGAMTMQQGGGVGYDFSTLRPAGAEATGVGAVASGPVSFMRIWDAMCATLLSTGSRRGAMMATLRCDHPDIEEFIRAKHDADNLRHFNLSVLVSDEFMQAVARDEDWPLVFPLGKHDRRDSDQVIERPWPGHEGVVPCRIYRRLRARELWQSIMRATYEYAEPGVLFIDRINASNNLSYCETIRATNPCGEVPLPAYGACDLGSINLTRFVNEPFTQRAAIDLTAIEETVAIAVRLLDNVIDVSQYPLSAQAQQARRKRRIGLGITGLADMFMMLGLHYASSAARETAAVVMRRLCHAAYRASVVIAAEKGSFPAFERDHYLHGRFIRSLPDDIRAAIQRDGIRNSHLVAIAPTGTISLLANNISSGLEPVFAARYRRRLQTAQQTFDDCEVVDFAVQYWRRLGRDGEPDTLVDARTLEPEQHLAMQAVLQPYVDSAISKTINVPENYSFDRFESLYQKAYEQGLKGCTTFRPNPVTGAILTQLDNAHCCTLERETD